MPKNNNVISSRSRRNRYKVRICNKDMRHIMVVHKTNKHIYINVTDLTGNALFTISTLDSTIVDMVKGKSGIDRATLVGETAGKRLMEKGITTAVFSRGASAYVGRVQALAEGVRKSGLVL